jgi:protein SCO1/2
VALASVVVVTAVWWALALWPAGASAPDWLRTTRAVCFGAAEGGLPDAGGWIALVVQPAVMAGVLLAIWGGELVAAGRALSRGRAGRTALALMAGALLLAGGAVAGRVRAATGPEAGEPLVPGADWRRIDRPAPPLELVDQVGVRFDLADLRGRPVLVTFGFAHCTTVCPRTVREALEAARALAELDAVVVVVTLDPWRDTPARLPSIAEVWGLAPRDRVLSGEVARVEAVLDAWEIGRSRDRQTGDIVHPAVTYVVDGAGRVAYRTPGDAGTLVRLTRGL